MTVPPCPNRAPSVPQGTAKTPQSDRAPVPLSIGTGHGTRVVEVRTHDFETKSVPPCIACGQPTDGPPSICSTCADERAAHRRSKRIARAQELDARLTKETKR